MTDENIGVAPRESVRVATVQLQMRPMRNLDAFFEPIERFVDAAAEYESDFVVFPELFTLQLAAGDGVKRPAGEVIDLLTGQTEAFLERFGALARARRVNIIGGSHLTRLPSGDVRNVCPVFLRDGAVHLREKLHPTPDERSFWGVSGGESADVIETDCGPVGVMICYDSEFPELGRPLIDQGARMLFTPYCTDTRHGHLRVTYCCQARAVENQCYSATSGTVGALPYVRNMDLHYAKSAIFTPCDLPFARDGIAAETTENTEMLAIADLNLAALLQARRSGAVQNLRDRRPDLYHVAWRQTADG